LLDPAIDEHFFIGEDETVQDVQDVSLNKAVKAVIGLPSTQEIIIQLSQSDLFNLLKLRNSHQVRCRLMF
jgi:hypothetical protein